MPAFPAPTPKWTYERCGACGGDGAVQSVANTPNGQKMIANECTACRGEGIVARRRQAA